ncbi:uncharacterized protein LOC115375285 [Myripristis murdjan]|uniref:uncharacterized protein LOC115375285 n=1 Tax=Myripristis murdjan TaxID=586833 RepID=UPI001175E8D4|nr:uncharacterized protein LOC115375285 [Myripristis murdjan]
MLHAEERAWRRSPKARACLQLVKDLRRKTPLHFDIHSPYGSVEYCSKRKSLMYSTRSSKLRKSSKKAQKSPSWGEDVIQRRTKGSRWTGQREARPADAMVISDDGTDHDLIDLIDAEQDAEHGFQEDEGKPIEVADESVSKSEDGDNDSVSGHSFCSTASGPSLLHADSLVKQSSPQGWCSGCRKLYQKAKKMTTPLKDKLLDNDPTSLTCDQWVLMKTWRPRRKRNVKGKLWTHLRQLKQLGEKRPVWCVGGREQSACSRPHTFLQRNLRQCVCVPVKSKRKTRGKRKRTRDHALGPRLTKQKRLHSSSLQQHTESKSAHNATVSLCPSSASSSSPVSSDDKTDTHDVIEVVPTAVTMDTSPPAKASAPHVVRKVRGGFRDLLAQLRGNSSVVIRETR